MTNNTAEVFDGASETDKLGYAYLNAKYHYDMAKKALDDAFNALMDIVPQKREGTTNLNGNFYEIKTSWKLNYSLEVDKLVEISTELPQDVLDAVVRRKYELAVKEYKDLKLSDSAQDNEYFKLIEQCVVVKPAKASVKVTELKQEKK